MGIKMECLLCTQSQVKVAEPKTEEGEGNLDPSPQSCYFLPSVQARVCVPFHKPVARQELWATCRRIWALHYP